MFRYRKIEDDSHRDLIRRVEKLEYMANNPAKHIVGDTITIFEGDGISRKDFTVIAVRMDYSFIYNEGEWHYEIFDDIKKTKRWVKEFKIVNK